MTISSSKEIRRNGYIATLRKARTGKKCAVCGFPIDSGQQYYEIVMGGGGLGSLKFPDHVHLECLNIYLGKERRR